MINLKLSKGEQEKAKKAMEVPPSKETYPWGTRLRFENQIIEKIPFLQDVKAGTTVDIKAIGKIVEVRVTDTEKGKNYESVEIQIQKIELGNANEAEESFNEE
jgi:hypothetical protein